MSTKDSETWPLRPGMEQALAECGRQAFGGGPPSKASHRCAWFVLAMVRWMLGKEASAHGRESRAEAFAALPRLLEGIGSRPEGEAARQASFIGHAFLREAKRDTVHPHAFVQAEREAALMADGWPSVRDAVAGATHGDGLIGIVAKAVAEEAGTGSDALPRRTGPKVKLLPRGTPYIVLGHEGESDEEGFSEPWVEHPSPKAMAAVLAALAREPVATGKGPTAAQQRKGARWAAILAEIRREPGITRKGIVAATGFKDGTVAPDLADMQRDGLIKCRDVGYWPLWNATT